VGALVRSFSPTALGFAGVLVLTGVFATWLHGGSVGALLGSDYGRLLLLKLGAFALVLAAGAYNFRRVLPTLGEDATTAWLRRSARLELAAGAVVLLITAMLVATARPYEERHPDAAGTAPATGAAPSEHGVAPAARFTSAGYAAAPPPLRPPPTAGSGRSA
jgi:hypothetical protein